MFRRIQNSEHPQRMLALLLIAGSLAVAPAAEAQDLVDPDAPDGIVERYLQLHGLDSVRAAQLRVRLARGGTAQERIEIAERLSEIYADLLVDTLSPADRQELERLSHDLLASVPSMDSFALRIKLAKAGYVQAERVAERSRVKLTTKEEDAEAERVLTDVRKVFREIATQASARVTQLTNQERRLVVEDDGQLRERIAAANADRSSALYYAGWSGYWLAAMTGRADLATDAMRDLGWLVGAEGNIPELDILNRAMLQFEHVSRAALGIALCASASGDHTGAKVWIRRLRDSGELHESVRDQLFSREAWILAQGRQWDELETLLSAGASGASRLSVADARLVAVAAMEAAAGDPTAASASIARRAIADLIAVGEVGHVLDLLRRYGTLPIGGDGFIVRYARGLLAYDEARSQHAALESDDQVPTERNDVALLYRAATDLLEPAFLAEDAATFGAERVRCGMTLGLTCFYRGRLIEAADWFEKSAAIATDPVQREESLWLALVALDRAVKGQNAEEARQRSERLALVFMNDFPQTERAATLLLRQIEADKIDPQRAIEVLLSVATDSPLYASSRRHLARLLYREYRRLPPDRRDEVAAQFLQVAEELLSMDEAEVARGTAEQAAAATQAVIVRVRQILDVVLSSDAPELARAEAALAALDRAANQMGISLDDLSAELAYRRLQIAVFRGEADSFDGLLAELSREGGTFARAADRLLYRYALDRWSSPGVSADDARLLVRFGGRILAHPDGASDRLSQESLLGVVERVSAASEWLADNAQDESMRALSLRLARQWFEEELWTEELLRRLARLAEKQGDKDLAYRAWSTLSVVYTAEELQWFEARYEAMRLLIDLDVELAREVMAQHKVLYPSFGPEPWGENIRKLDARLELLPRLTLPGGSSP